jgi:hypothetical protein
VIRHCADCGAPFSLEPEEEDWFRRECLTLPRRCGRCRSNRRAVKERHLTCRRCGRTFVWPRDIQLYARTYGWKEPRHCVGGCPGRTGDPETDEERAMRELLEELHGRRDRADAPPLKAVLEAQRSRPRRPPPGPSPDALFSGLADDPEEDPAARKLLDGVEQFGQQRATPDDLFSGLGGEERTKKRRKKKRRLRRRPRPRPRRDPTADGS